VRRALLFTVIALAGCGSSDSDEDTERFEADGIDITFEYPSEMNEADKVQIASGAGSSAKATAGVGYGEKDSKDLILVQRYDLNQTVDDDNLDVAKRELDSLVKQISPSAEPGETGETSGFPSIEYEDVEVKSVEGAESRLVALFDGDVEYLVNCQSTPDRRADIDKACKQALETVEKK
jgi:hypothetical protein